MKRIIPDANIFIRYFLNDIASQVTRAEKVFEKAKKKEIELIIPQIVIFEILFILEKYYKFDKAELKEKLKSILSTDYFNIIERSVFLKELEIWSLQNISFPDAFIISFSEVNQADIFSFDKKLNKRITSEKNSP